MSHTLGSLWANSRERLEAAGVEAPALDARLLLESVLGLSRLHVLADPSRAISDAQTAAVDEAIRRRAAREPLAYILGHKSFWTIDLAIDGSVLVPRPETELLVEAAISAIARDGPAQVLDLGVGSGAILLSILNERPMARGVGVDVSERAVEIARCNAERLGLSDRVEIRRADWWRGVEGEFDVIVANPPYISTAEFEHLSAEVTRYEPRLALDGGPDGLGAHRKIIGGLQAHLRSGGGFALEVGDKQSGVVRRLADEAGLVTDPPLLDLAGIPRAVKGRKVAPTEKPLGSGGGTH